MYVVLSYSSYVFPCPFQNSTKTESGKTSSTTESSSTVTTPEVVKHMDPLNRKKYKELKQKIQQKESSRNVKINRGGVLSATVHNSESGAQKTEEEGEGGQKTQEVDIKDQQKNVKLMEQKLVEYM